MVLLVGDKCLNIGTTAKVALFGINEFFLSYPEPYHGMKLMFHEDIILLSPLLNPVNVTTVRDKPTLRFNELKLTLLLGLISSKLELCFCFKKSQNKIF